MTGPWHLGNDVVDLLHPGGVGKGRDPRFLQRVCSEAEQRNIRGSLSPDVALWAHWAAKEAIFKSASKALGTSPVFHHPAFEVDFSPAALHHFLADEGCRGGAPLEGEGRYRNLSFQVRAEQRGESVHAISWTRDEGRGHPSITCDCRDTSEETRGPSSDLQAHFSPLEWRCVTHRASALTRLLARRALAQARGVPEEILEIRCGPGAPGRRIPSVWLRGKALPVDLTLSHHGRFLAYAFLSQPSSPGYLSRGR
jgi:hypothetical protein